MNRDKKRLIKTLYRECKKKFAWWDIDLSYCESLDRREIKREIRKTREFKEEE